MDRRQSFALEIGTELLDRLVAMAKTRGCSVSKLALDILGDFVRDDESRGTGAERRTFKRFPVEVPAMVYVTNKNSVGRYHSAKVVDISMGGARISVAVGRGDELEIIRGDSEFEIILAAKDDPVPLYFRCRSRRVVPEEDAVDIGASFQESDEVSRGLLQQYLM